MRRPRQAKNKETYITLIVLGAVILVWLFGKLPSDLIYQWIIGGSIITLVAVSIPLYLFYRKQKAKRNALKLLAIAEVDILDGVTFEKFVAEQLKKQGYHVQNTATTGDYGIDLIASKDGIKTAVQCKRYSKPVGVSAIQEVYGGIAYYGCQHSMVVTNNTFTKRAVILARSNKCTLVDREELGKWLASEK